MFAKTDIEAEVRYATRCEYAQTAIDFIARRSRLAFQNNRVALATLPRVIDIMVIASSKVDGQGDEQGARRADRDVA